MRFGLRLAREFAKHKTLSYRGYRRVHRSAPFNVVMLREYFRSLAAIFFQILARRGPQPGINVDPSWGFSTHLALIFPCCSALNYSTFDKNGGCGTTGSPITKSLRPSVSAETLDILTNCWASENAKDAAQMGL